MYRLMVLLANFYFISSMLFMIRALALAFFKKVRNFKQRKALITRAVVYSFFWPLALLSKSGRREFYKTFIQK